jgi:hypothetical protein
VIRAYRQACAICRLRHDETKTLVGLLLALGRRPSGVRLA